MVKGKNKKIKPNGDIIINKESESGLAEFIQRPVPTEKDVEEFEEMVDEISYSGVSFANKSDKRGTISLKDDSNTDINKELDEEIDESLHEIYQDKNGDMVDVRKMDIKKRHGLLFWLFAVVFITGAMAGAAYAVYNYFYLGSGTDATAVEFSIEGKSDVVAAEEFFYSIHYKNASNISIKNVRISAQFPDNFIFLDSYPESRSEKLGTWEFDSVAANRAGKIKIKGMMVGSVDEIGIILSDMSYTPENFSSEFRKESSLTTIIKDTGLDFDFDYVGSALVGQEDEIVLRVEPKEKNFINSFRFTVEPQENVSLFLTPESKDKKDGSKALVKEIRQGVWEVENITTDEIVIPLTIKFKDKLSDKQDLVIFFEKIIEDTSASGTAPSRFIRFFDGILSFEVMKSDLNLTLIINGSRNDQGVDFGQTLNYSIVYNNKGETSMKDVVIMAVLESDFLNWVKLNDFANGRERGNTITWSKEEIPELEELDRHAEGTIDFSIDILEIGEIEEGKDYDVKSYAHFSIGEIEDPDGEAKTEPKTEEDNRSNTIINKINSDLELIESVRYFNVDNIPVGTGPHPPKVGENTTYKVYWDITNNLHELNDLNIKVKLPDYIGWAEKERATVGTISYIQESNEVVWDIGRLPITVFQANAEFSISVTPSEIDKNTIMVLLPGSLVSAVDSETEVEISDGTRAKTTKLEDDDIAIGGGVVE